MGEKQSDGEKVSGYECGFDAFESSRVPFSVRFFLVGLLFMLFDLEISFLFPWSVVFDWIGLGGSGGVFVFLLVLVAGLVYEWVKGGLEWDGTISSIGRARHWKCLGLLIRVQPRAFLLILGKLESVRQFWYMQRVSNVWERFFNSAQLVLDRWRGKTSMSKMRRREATVPTIGKFV